MGGVVSRTGSYDLEPEVKNSQEEDPKPAIVLDPHRQLMTKSTIKRRKDFRSGAGQMEWEGKSATSGDLIRASSCKKIALQNATLY